MHPRYPGCIPRPRHTVMHARFMCVQCVRSFRDHPRPRTHKHFVIFHSSSLKMAPKTPLHRTWDAVFRGNRDLVTAKASAHRCCAFLRPGLNVGTTRTAQLEVSAAARIVCMCSPRVRCAYPLYAYGRTYALMHASSIISRAHAHVHILVDLDS